MKDIWLPDSLYNLKPWLMMLIAIAVPPLFNEHLLAIFFSIILFCYSVFILIKRFMWKDSSLLDMSSADNDRPETKDDS